MAKPPTASRPILIHFGGPSTTLMRKRGGTVPTAPKPTGPTAPTAPRPAGPAAAPPPPPPPAAPADAAGQAAAFGPFGQLSTALNELAESSATNVTRLGEIRDALGKLTEIAGAVDGLKAAYATTVDALGGIRDAVGQPLALSPEIQQQLATAVGYFGRMAAALEQDVDQQTGAPVRPTVRGAALLALAAGEGGNINHGLEGKFFATANFNSLADAAKVQAEEFIRRMEAALKQSPGLLGSRLVKDVTSEDLVFIHETIRLAHAAAPKGKKPATT